MKKIVPLLIAVNLAGLSGLAQADNLLQVYQQVQKTNPQLKKAEADRNAAYATIGVSRGSLLPSLSISGSYLANNGTRSQDQQNYTTANASLSLTMSLFDYNKWASLSIAKKQAAISDITLQATQQQIILNTATSYFNVLKAMDSLSLVIAKRNAIYKQLQQTEERYKVGLVPITDMQNAQSKYDKTLSDEVTARNNLNNALENLRQISGEYYTQLSSLNTSLFKTQQPEKVSQLLDLAHQHNLSIINAKLSKSLSLEQIRSAESGYLPTVSLSASSGLTRHHTFGNNNIPGNNIGGGENVSINVNIPLFSGGTTYAATQAANYNYVSSNESLEETTRKINNDVYSSYNSIIAAISLEKANTQAVISAQSSLDATVAGYKVGTRTIVDVLNATTDLYTAKQQLSDTRYNYLISLLQMKSAAGTLSEQDLVSLNSELGSPIDLEKATKYHTTTADEATTPPAAVETTAPSSTTEGATSSSVTTPATPSTLSTTKTTTTNKTGA